MLRPASGGPPDAPRGLRTERARCLQGWRPGRGTVRQHRGRGWRRGVPLQLAAALEGREELAACQLRRDAAAGVLHSEPNQHLVGRHAPARRIEGRRRQQRRHEAHVAALGVLDGVGEQIEQHLRAARKRRPRSDRWCDLSEAHDDGVRTAGGACGEPCGARLLQLLARPDELHARPRRRADHRRLQREVRLRTRQVAHEQAAGARARAGARDGR